MGSQKKTFRKIGGGTALLLIGGKHVAVEHGKTVKATDEEIPAGMRDLFEEIGKHTPKSPTRKETRQAEDSAGAEPPVFEVVQVDGSPGWYNVINKATGKPQSANKLRAEQARKLVKDLTDETKDGGE